jgi:hypothetical protein
VGKRNSKSAYVVACVTPHPLPRKFQRQEWADRTDRVCQHSTESDIQMCLC